VRDLLHLIVSWSCQKDIGDAAIAASHDPLDVAEGTVDGLGFITVADEGILAERGHDLLLFFPSSILARQPDRLNIGIARPAFHHMSNRFFQGPSLNPVKIGNNDGR